MNASEREVAGRFLECVTGGRAGVWPVTPRSAIKRKPSRWLSTDGVVEFLTGEGWGRMDYFVPYPFAREERTFSALVDSVGLVRVDLDPPGGMPFEDQQAFVEERLDEVRLLLGEPTAVVDSGRGRWVYLRLSEPVSKEQAKRLNQGLHAMALSADPKSYNPAQWVRLPGSVNEKTGRRAVVTEVEANRLFDPVGLDLALREFLPKKRQKASTGFGRDFHWSGDKLADVVLPDPTSFSSALQEYIESAATTEESLARWGRTRHQIEMRVFIRLASSGWTNLQIHAFAYQQGLSRYMEEFEKKSPYGDLSVSKARKWVDEHPLPEKPTTTPLLSNRREFAPPSPDDDVKPPSGQRVSHLKFFLLKEIDGSRPGALYSRMESKFTGRRGVKRRNLQRLVSWFIDEGWVDRVKGDDGLDRLVRTEDGDRLACRRFLPAPLMGYRLSADGLEGRKRASETRKERERLLRLSRQARRTGSVGARQRRIARNRLRANFDGRLRLHFEGLSSAFYLQIVTASDQIATVDLYRQLHVGFDDDRLPLFANAVAFSDPALEEPESEDPARSRGRKPWRCSIAVGAFLTRTSDSFEVASMPNWNGELVPAVGLLVEDTTRFWSALWNAIPDFEGRIVRIRRSGSWCNRSFSFEDVGEAIPLGDLLIPDLDDYLDEIGSSERFERLVAEQPEHATLRFYPR